MVRIAAVGSASLRIWIAAAPTPELPPRTRTDFGWGPVDAPSGRKGRGIFRAE